MDGEHAKSPPAVERLDTGIAGFDRVLGGGLPRGYSLLVAGESGTGKTVLLNEFLYRGMTRLDEPGVLVTCEEPADAIRRHVAGFGWDYPALEAAGKLAIVDVSPSPHELVTVELNERYSLAPLLAIIEGEVQRLGARRVAIDNLTNLFVRFRSEAAVRDLFHQLTARLQALGVTSFISAERHDGRSALSEHHLEEFVAEGVVVLGQSPGELRTVRRLSITKLRGLNYQSGLVEFQIDAHGLEVFPRIPLKTGMAPEALTERVSSGIGKMDGLLHGGFPRGHVILLSGGTGSGKTVFGLQFVQAGLAAGESAIVVSVEESREQLLHEARNFGWDLAAAREQGRLAFIDVPFSGMRTDQILYQIVNKAGEIGAKRLVMDSISALVSSGATQREVRLFLEQLVSFCKAEGITALLTYAISGAFGAAAGQLLGGTAITEARLSSIVDAIILLNYVEHADRVDKLMSVLKVRGSPHDPGIYRFEITGHGIEIGEKQQ